MMANEKRLIDINKFPLLPSRLDGDMSEYERGYLDAQKNMNLLPTVDAVEVVHGRWIEKPYLLGTTRYCSICGQNYGMPHGVFNYCPNCGAKMDKTENP